MVAFQMRLYDGVAFGVEGNGADGCPVSSVARPARRIELSSPEVQGMPRRQDRIIVTRVALSGADVTNATMAMIEVVPMHKASRPSACLVEIGDNIIRMFNANG